MRKKYSELREEASKSLDGKWMMAALATLIYIVIAAGVSSIPFIGTVLAFLIGYPLVYGYYILLLDGFRGAEKLELGTLFEGFKDYGRIFGTMFLMFIYLFLWTLLLVIPGIIKGYSYALTPYILRDEPQLKFNGAIEKKYAHDGRTQDGSVYPRFDFHRMGFVVCHHFRFGIFLGSSLFPNRPHRFL